MAAAGGTPRPRGRAPRGAAGVTLEWSHTRGKWVEPDDDCLNAEAAAFHARLEAARAAAAGEPGAAAAASSSSAAPEADDDDDDEQRGGGRRAAAAGGDGGGEGGVRSRGRRGRRVGGARRRARRAGACARSRRSSALTTRWRATRRSARGSRRPRSPTARSTPRATARCSAASPSTASAGGWRCGATARSRSRRRRRRRRGRRARPRRRTATTRRRRRRREGEYVAERPPRRGRSVRGARRRVRVPRRWKSYGDETGRAARSESTTAGDDARWWRKAEGAAFIARALATAAPAWRHAQVHGGTQSVRRCKWHGRRECRRCSHARPSSTRGRDGAPRTRAAATTVRRSGGHGRRAVKDAREEEARRGSRLCGAQSRGVAHADHQRGGLALLAAPRRRSARRWPSRNRTRRAAAASDCRRAVAVRHRGSLAERRARRRYIARGSSRPLVATEAHANSCRPTRSWRGG